MVMKVAGVWEVGWSVPTLEYDQWSFMMQDFGVDEMIMCPVTGIDRGTDSKLVEYADMDAILAANTLPVVWVDETAETDLATFTHPTDVLYIFGKANFSPFLTHFREGDLSVSIKTLANEGLLWPHQAAAILLYDRMQKQG
jgi:hypothetical protein